MANEPKPQGHRVEIILGRCPPYKYAPFRSILTNGGVLSYAMPESSAFVCYFETEELLQLFKEGTLKDFTSYANQENVAFQIIHSTCSITTVRPS